LEKAWDFYEAIQNMSAPALSHPFFMYFRLLQQIVRIISFTNICKINKSHLYQTNFLCL